MTAIGKYLDLNAYEKDDQKNGYRQMIPHVKKGFNGDLLGAQEIVYFQNDDRLTKSDYTG